jgi:TPR repeat protein
MNKQQRRVNKINKIDYSPAMYNLAVIYSRERREDSNFNKAIQYYKRLIELYYINPTIQIKEDCTSSYINLGVLYEYGTGLPQSYEKAREYYEKASLHNSERGQKNLNSLFLYKVLKMEENSFIWYEKEYDKVKINEKTLTSLHQKKLLSENSFIYKINILKRKKFQDKLYNSYNYFTDIFFE